MFLQTPGLLNLDRHRVTDCRGERTIQFLKQLSESA
jgi:hypothetical protein